MYRKRSLVSTIEEHIPAFNNSSTNYRKHLLEIKIVWILSGFCSGITDVPLSIQTFG